MDTTRDAKRKAPEEGDDRDRGAPTTPLPPIPEDRHDDDKDTPNHEFFSYADGDPSISVEGGDVVLSVASSGEEFASGKSGGEGGEEGVSCSRVLGVVVDDADEYSPAQGSEYRLASALSAARERKTRNRLQQLQEEAESQSRTRERSTSPRRTPTSAPPETEGG